MKNPSDPRLVDPNSSTMQLNQSPSTSFEVQASAYNNPDGETSPLSDSFSPIASPTPYPSNIHRSLSSTSATTGRAPVLQAVAKRSPFGALLTRTLPNYSGVYEVGVCDIELPIDHSKRGTYGNFRHKNMPDREAGLRIETVLWTMFYPVSFWRTLGRCMDNNGFFYDG
jgi:platelet-activating factor acetylhydrolase